MNLEKCLEHNLPLTHELKIKSHSKSVAAVAMDRGGGVLVTGSNDY